MPPQPKSSQRRPERQSTAAIDELPVVEVQMNEAVESSESTRQHAERVGRRQLEQLGPDSEERTRRGPGSWSRGDVLGEVRLLERRRMCSRRSQMRRAPRRAARRDTSRHRRSTAEPGRGRAATRLRRERPRLRPPRLAGAPGSGRPSACDGRAAPAWLRDARARARAPSSSPGRTDGGLSRGVTTKPAGRRSQEALEGAPDRVVEQSLDVTRDDRVAFELLHDAHLRTEAEDLCCRRRLAAASAAARGAGARARDRSSAAYTEKSDDFARTFVAIGNVRLRRRASLGVDPAALRLLPGPALLGPRPLMGGGRARADRRSLRRPRCSSTSHRDWSSPRLALLVAVVATLNPYLIWHDVHVNREITDQVVLAAIVLVVAARRAPSLTRPSSARSAHYCGVAILGNSRLAALPLVLAVFVWRLPPRPQHRRRTARRRHGRDRDLTVARSQRRAGRLLRDHHGRARALESQQPQRPTRPSRPASGSTTSRQPSSFPPTPQDAATVYHETGRFPAVERMRPDALLRAPDVEVLVAPSGREGQACGARRRSSSGIPAHTRRRDGRAKARGATRPAASSSPSGRSRSTLLAVVGLFVARRPVRRARR